MPKTKELTDKQQAFCREYVKDWNGKEAAIRAGYAPKYADRQAYRLVENSRVKAEIGRLLAEIEQVSTVEVAEIVQELRRLAFIKPQASNNTDKLRALELLGRYKAMFTDKVVTATDEQRTLTETEQAEARRLADIRLRETA